MQEMDEQQESAKTYYNSFNLDEEEVYLYSDVKNDLGYNISMCNVDYEEKSKLDDAQGIKLEPFITEKPASPENAILQMNDEVLDLSKPKSQNIKGISSETDTNQVYIIDLSNYFETSGVTQRSSELRKTPHLENYVPYISPFLNSDSGFNISLHNVEDEEKSTLDDVQNIKFIPVNREKSAHSPENGIRTVNDEVMDFNKPTSQNIKDTGSESDTYIPNYFETSGVSLTSSELEATPLMENNARCISPDTSGIQFSVDDDVNSANILENGNLTLPNDNLLLLANCSLIYGGLIDKENKPSFAENNIDLSKMQPKLVRDTVIKYAARYQKIDNTRSDEVQSQPQLDSAIDIINSPQKVKRSPPENRASEYWEIIRAGHEIQTSSNICTKRLIMEGENQPKERIPKMIIKKMEDGFCSYFKNE